MNTYHKFCPKVFVAKCTEQHSKGDIIEMTTKYGKVNECHVWNLVGKNDTHFFYSITRTDGFNSQERMSRKSERFGNAALNSKRQSNAAFDAAQEGKDFLSLGEPIKVGHHSEKRHRALIERNHNRMRKSVELDRKAEKQQERADYYAKMADKIDLSMPESLEFYEFKLEEAKQRQSDIKSGIIPRDHSFTLQYATKHVKEIQKQLDIARLLWA